MCEKNIDGPTSHTSSTGDLARNPGMCPDQELNLRPFSLQGDSHVLSHISQGSTPVRACCDLWHQLNTCRKESHFQGDWAPPCYKEMPPVLRKSRDWRCHPAPCTWPAPSTVPVTHDLAGTWGREKMRKILSIWQYWEAGEIVGHWPDESPKPKGRTLRSCQPVLGKDVFLFFKGFIYLFIYLFRGEGREKERQRNISVWLPLAHLLLGTWPATQAYALTGNWTGDPSNPLSYTSQSRKTFLKKEHQHDSHMAWIKHLCRNPNKWLILRFWEHCNL